MWLLLLLGLPFSSPNTYNTQKQPNPLTIFNEMWNDPKYNYCHTAKNITYLTPIEKDIIFILNLIRQYPADFNKTVVAYWPGYMDDVAMHKSGYYQSLIRDLKTMQPVGILHPDSLAWISARCHAVSSGKKGYLGHDRLTEECIKHENYKGECCHYGFSNALEIVMSLLIDEGVANLGHRKICLSNKYNGVGASLQSHTTYRYVTVIDFSAR